MTLTELHVAIIAGLKSALPDVPTIEAYPVIQRRIRLPAVVLELSEIEPGSDPGTGQVAVVGRFQARCIVDPVIAGADMVVREMAAAVILALQYQMWGITEDVAPARFLQAGDDGFKPNLDGYLVWMVEWHQEFHIGAFKWVWPDDTGLEVMLGMYPETGSGKEPKYWPLSALSPDNWGETS